MLSDRKRLTTAAITSLLLLLAGCSGPKYEAFQVTLDEAPGAVYRFSAADATDSSPIFMSVDGRELTPADSAVRTTLIRHWVAAHAPKGATMSHWASAECGLEREGEFPGCDIFGVDDQTTGKKIEYYFYAGNWPFNK